jgi:hypothetical protein
VRDEGDEEIEKERITVQNLSDDDGGADHLPREESSKTKNGLESSSGSVILGVLGAGSAFVVFVFILIGVLTYLLSFAVCIIHPFFFSQLCSATNRNTGSYEKIRKHAQRRMKSKFRSGEDR